MNLLQNSLVLTFARLTNYAVMLVTPLVLVRMLDVSTYGQYREFLLYATVLVAILALAIRDNLMYVVPRQPESAEAAVSQTIGMLLVTSTLGMLVFFVGRDWFMAKASFDFAVPLMLYVFFFINFDVVENYWLARQQARHVLIYSTLRILARVIVVVGATYYFGDLKSILYCTVVLEILKSLVCIYLLWRLRLLTMRIDRTLLVEQLRFIAPLSGAGLLFFLNEKAGQLYVSTVLGASALAVYTVGTYQLPIVAIIRSAVSDTLFPEMVRHAANDSTEGLDLWRLANVYYCYLVFPVFMLLFVFADLFIVTLFTEAYREATGVFQIALLVMIRQCFEMGTPLRAANANRHVLWGNVIAVVVHLPLLFVLSKAIGILGAAVAWLVADLMIACYLASRIMERYNIPLSGLALWPQVLKLAAAAALALPPLLLASYFTNGSLLAAFAASLVFGGLYIGLVKLIGVTEIDALLQSLLGLLRRFLPGMAR
jgi:O-antigen/teichoic acid export membrane protein